MTNKRRSFPTLKEAEKFYEVQRIMHPEKTKDWGIFDLIKAYPRRKKGRYFVGNNQEWR